MKQTTSDVPEQGHDMVRMRGFGLRLMREDDAIEEIAGLQQQVFDADPMVAAMAIDRIARLQRGACRATVPAWDPRSGRAEKIGEENPIEWVRATERMVREAKRRRRISK